MPITLNVSNEDPIAMGHCWIINDQQKLARLIATVAVGQSDHAARVLNQLGATSQPRTTENAKANAIRNLTVPAGSDPWHRDGWLFQIMSWIAALKANPNSLMAAPHLIHAQKGFDGVLLEFDHVTKSISAVVILEDKATDNPRATIRDLVWPEFESLEQGFNEHLLISQITSLLKEARVDEVEEVVSNVIWNDVRRFRVSITVGDGHASSEGRKTLFKDYDDVVKGPLVRRSGDTFHVVDLRNWMAQLAADAIHETTLLGA